MLLSIYAMFPVILAQEFTYRIGEYAKIPFFKFLMNTYAVINHLMHVLNVKTMLLPTVPLL